MLCTQGKFKITFKCLRKLQLPRNYQVITSRIQYIEGVNNMQFESVPAKVQKLVDHLRYYMFFPHSEIFLKSSF